MTSETKGFNLTTPQKKAAVFGSIALVGVAAVVLMANSTEKEAEPAPVEIQSLTGGADVRAVTMDGLGKRLEALEQSGTVENRLTSESIEQLDRKIQALVRGLEVAETRHQKAMAQITQLKAKQALAPKIVYQPNPPEAGKIAPELVTVVPQGDMQQELIEQREAIYRPADPMPDLSSRGSRVAPRISVFQAEPVEEQEKNRIKINIPAGSIIQAVLLTGLDAPTGTQASGAPVPVLMRIEKEAIMPNYAMADVKDCHLLGAAYGELASERANIRGETISCILADGSAVEGNVKFFVAGEDGKQGLKGRLVTRAGRMIAAAAGAALIDGFMGALDDSSETIDLVGLSGASSSAIDGASKGLEQITDYYIELAEETFPVIEVTNGRWVDVILTKGLEIEWKGNR